MMSAAAASILRKDAPARVDVSKLVSFSKQDLAIRPISDDERACFIAEKDKMMEVISAAVLNPVVSAARLAAYDDPLAPLAFSFSSRITDELGLKGGRELNQCLRRLGLAKHFLATGILPLTTDAISMVLEGDERFDAMTNQEISVVALGLSKFQFFRSKASRHPARRGRKKSLLNRMD